MKFPDDRVKPENRIVPPPKRLDPKRIKRRQKNRRRQIYHAMMVKTETR